MGAADCGDNCVCGLVDPLLENRQPEIEVLVVSASHQLSLAQKVDWPRADVLTDAVAHSSGWIHDLGGARCPKAEPGADTMTDQQDGLQPSRVVTKDGKEDIDNACVAVPESNAIRVGEERALNEFTIEDGVGRQGARGNRHVTPNVRVERRATTDANQTRAAYWRVRSPTRG